MNRLASKVYKIRALCNHPVHEAYKTANNDYGNTIKKPKVAHWMAFLEGMTGRELWTTNRYISNPVSDGGKQCIPTLKVTDRDRHGYR